MRVYASDNDPVDYCMACAPSEAVAQERHGNVGDGPDGRGNCFAYEAEHPDYEGDMYKCAACRRQLNEYDA